MEYKAAVTGLSAEEVAEVRKQPDRLVKRKKEPGQFLVIISGLSPHPPNPVVLKRNGTVAWYTFVVD